MSEAGAPRRSPPVDPHAGSPASLGTVRLFLAALGILLVGYMFLGRGFAHLGVRPVYLGEVVLALGVVATVTAIVRLKPRLSPPPLIWLLVAFMAWGSVRTLPYLGQYGMDALRDGVLWGYGLFAIIVYILVDRRVLLRAMTAYAWVVPAFALWVPISWNLFQLVSTNIDPGRPGDVVPLIFFKSGDMAVHIVGSIAFLVVGAAVAPIAVRFVWRALVALPLSWTLFVTSTSNRGALLSAAAGLGLAALLTRHRRRWLPVLSGAALAAMIFALPSIPPGIGQPGVSPGVSPGVTATTSESGQPTPSGAESTAPKGRPIGVGQLIENVTSIFGKTGDSGLEGTKQFRLAWWREIVHYTVYGPYFWTGKGFGVNLADDDGFQVTADRSLRAPHNSHMSALARMGVPGFALWILLQGGFGIGLLRSVLAHRREGGAALAALGAWILVYWAAMMVNTSFDPYLEGPQGGIWFWSLFGLGLVVMRLVPRRRDA